MYETEDLEFTLGIDIGSTKVCAVITRSKSNKLEVIGAGKAECEGVSRGNINNLYKTKEAIETALEDATRQAGFSKGDLDNLYANVNIGGTYLETKREFNTINRKSSGDNVNSEDLNALFYDIQQRPVAEGWEILHVLPLHFTVDDEQQIYNPVGHIGRKLSGDFQLITAKKTVLKNIKSALDINSIPVQQDQVILSPLASGMSVLDEKQKKVGVCMVDIGGGTTDVAIYNKGILQHVAILPFAGRHITKDIEEGCNLDTDSAEEAKLVISNADPNACQVNGLLVVPTTDGIPAVEIMAKNVALIMRARLREIAALVLSEIKKAGYDRKLHAGIILTGGSAMIKNIDKVFAGITDMHVQVSMPKGLESTGVYEDIASDPSYATALGLAWSSMKPLDPRLNARMAKQPETGAKEEPHKKTTWLNFGKIKEQFRGIWNDDLPKGSQLNDEY